MRDLKKVNAENIHQNGKRKRNAWECCSQRLQHKLAAPAQSWIFQSGSRWYGAMFSVTEWFHFPQKKNLSAAPEMIPPSYCIQQKTSKLTEQKYCSAFLLNKSNILKQTPITSPIFYAKQVSRNDCARHLFLKAVNISQLQAWQV